MEQELKQKAAAGLWRLDRRVPLGFVLAIFLQTATGIWWASAEVKRQEYQDQRLSDLSQQLAASDGAMPEVMQKLARIEERTAALADQLSRVENRLK